MKAVEPPLELGVAAAKASLYAFSETLIFSSAAFFSASSVVLDHAS